MGSGSHSALFQPPTAHIYRCKTRTEQLAKKKSLSRIYRRRRRQRAHEPMSVPRERRKSADSGQRLNGKKKTRTETRPSFCRESSLKKRRSIPPSPHSATNPFLFIHHRSHPHIFFLPNKQSKILVTLFLPYPQR